MPSAAEAPPFRDVQGVRVPTLIYGTAWKEAETTRLTGLAISAGFRGIDTANQRRHYYEAGVGEAVRAALEGGSLARSDLFLQTKFTYPRGQDERLPYDPAAPVSVQVEQSMASSLEHLHVEHVDALLLHGPSAPVGLSADDLEAWRAMEQLQRARLTRLVGVSNVSLEQLEILHSMAKVKPAIVQNRCFTRPHADGGVRAFCRDHGILYEGFSLLTAHRNLMGHPTVAAIARRTGMTPAQTILRFALEEGMAVLTGTTSPEHMAQDLDLYRFLLEGDELAALTELLT